MQNIPVLNVAERSLAETYEQALIRLYSEGTRFRTQYDQPGDPLSLDCTMNMTILEPESDPMIHQAFPGGIDDLKEYVMELKGFKDHWVKNMNDPDDTRWEYQWLNCNIRFRSNDAWGASFMNMFGFIQFNREIIAAEIEKRSGKTVRLGRINWQADSYHIYGKDIEAARSMLFNRLEEMPFENRIFNFHDEFIQQMYQDAEAMVLKKIEEYDKMHS